MLKEIRSNQDQGTAAVALKGMKSHQTQSAEAVKVVKNDHVGTSEATGLKEVKDNQDRSTGVGKLKEIESHQTQSAEAIKHKMTKHS